MITIYRSKSYGRSQQGLRYTGECLTVNRNNDCDIPQTMITIYRKQGLQYTANKDYNIPEQVLR